MKISDFDTQMGMIALSSQGAKITTRNNMSAFLLLRTGKDAWEPFTIFDKGLVRHEYLNQEEKMEVTPLPRAESDALIKEYLAYVQMLREEKNYANSAIVSNGTFKFLVGSDPEIFVETSDKKLFPAFDFLGSKAKTTAKTFEGCGAYWDGFQAEFETKPDPCLQYHCDKVQAGLELVLKEARKVDPGAKLSHKTVMDIPAKMLKEAAPEHVEFGCMPSYNAYGIRGLSIPGRECTFRPAGGHIHFGIGKTHKGEDLNRMVKGLDAILGVACVSLFAKFDDPRRRQLYGLPGEYRLPPHGLEYRTLSNAWLLHPLAMHLVFDLARAALKKAYFYGFEDWEATQDEVLQCIMTSDVELARKILKRNKELFIKLMFEAYGWMAFGDGKKKAEMAFEAYLHGIESIVENPKDIENNWHLGKGTWRTHSAPIGGGVIMEDLVRRAAKEAQEAKLAAKLKSA